MPFLQELSPARARLIPRVHTALWTVVLVAVVWTGCALPADECAAEDSRCVGAIVQVCKTHPAGYAADFHHYDRSPNTWESLVTCPSADLCKTTPWVSSSGTHVHDAFCSLAPTPDANCSGQTKTVCEATTALDCTQGFPTASHACASCDQGKCTGALWDGCNDASGCAAGMICRFDGAPIGFCEMPCTCPEGATCDACNAAVHDTAGSTAAYRWVCSAGLCSQDYDD
ncbi:MAG TPA: hypothetical protein VGI39_03580 [Polyangiaceae bacterium]|jgi:hypothetical protein